MDKVWFLAVSKSDLKLLDALLEVNGVDVDSYNSDGHTALYVACRNGQLELIKFLVSRGADVNKLAKNMSSSCLQIASLNGHADVVEYLSTLKVNVNVNHANSKKFTALHGAASKGHLKVVELLLKSGADVYITDEDGRTAVDWAKESGFVECFALLQKVVDIDDEYKDNYDIVVSELQKTFDEMEECKAKMPLAKVLAEEAKVVVLAMNFKKALAKELAEDAVNFVTSNKLEKVEKSEPLKMDLSDKKLVITVTDFDRFKRVMELISKNI